MTDANDMSDAALLPCAHCAGPAQLISGQPGCHYVRCEACGMTGPDASRGRAIAAWNRRAGQAHDHRADAGLLAALQDQIDGCSMIVRMLSGQENRVAHSLKAMLNAQIDAARAAITAAKGTDQ